VRGCLNLAPRRRPYGYLLLRPRFRMKSLRARKKPAIAALVVAGLLAFPSDMDDTALRPHRALHAKSLPADAAAARTVLLDWRRRFVSPPTHVTRLSNLHRTVSVWHASTADYIAAPARGLPELERAMRAAAQMKTR
jgi:hypothetical protein